MRLDRVKIHFLKSQVVAEERAIFGQHHIRNRQRVAPVQRMPADVEQGVDFFQVFAVHVAPEHFLIDSGVNASSPAQFHGLFKPAEFQAVLVVVAVNLEYPDLQAPYLSFSEFRGGAACPGSLKAARTPPFSVPWAGSPIVPAV